eukprot:TRINITY_DN3108_c1_g1_i1.p1 TRINITY_DN3108_c1_g1~~TRINITY_DN3108_c1_g1_i1.p1  ORF type:complete len:321 (-),score=122.03 TRINITY_DN3108_c1_g1_i1:731-1693(-)
MALEIEDFPISLDCLEFNSDNCKNKFEFHCKALIVKNKLSFGNSIEVAFWPQKNKYFILKTCAHIQHASSEYTANLIYLAAGILVPKSKTYNDFNGCKILYEAIEGVSLIKFKQTAPNDKLLLVNEQIQKGFIIDCLIANSEVYGDRGEHLLIDNDNLVWRANNSGALNFLISGLKKDAWAPNVTELFTLRKSSTIGREVYQDFGLDLIAIQFIDILTNGTKEKILTITSPTYSNIIMQRFDCIEKFVQNAQNIEFDSNSFYVNSSGRHINFSSNDDENADDEDEMDIHNNNNKKNIEIYIYVYIYIYICIYIYKFISLH